MVAPVVVGMAELPDKFPVSLLSTGLDVRGSSAGLSRCRTCSHTLIPPKPKTPRRMPLNGLFSMPGLIIRVKIFRQGRNRLRLPLQTKLAEYPGE